MEIRKLNNPHIKIISTIGMLLSGLGLVDTTYLTIAHYTQTVTLACPATAFINCQKVTTSSYSAIHGLPVAVLGLVFFGVMLLLQLPISWRLDNKLFSFGRLLFALAGLAGVFWFVWVELYRLGSICLYCTAAHLLIFGLFVITLLGTSMIPPTDDRLKKE